MSLLTRAARSCNSLSKAKFSLNNLRQVRLVSNDGSNSNNTTQSAFMSVLGDNNTQTDSAGLGAYKDLLSPLSSGQSFEAGKDGISFDLQELLNSKSFAAQEGPHHLHINASYNNTILTLTSPNGQVLAATSGGTAGFKKAARSGYEAAHQATLQLLTKIQEKNLRINNLHIIFKGFGPGRDAAFKAFTSSFSGNCKTLTDATPVPFGGCRPKKARRL